MGMAMRLLSLGKLMAQKQNYAVAKERLIESISLFEDVGDCLRIGEVYEHLAFLADRLGEKEEAEGYRKESIRTLTGHSVVSLSVVQRLAEYYEQRHSYLDALQCYWQSLQIAREIGYETKELEEAVQRISKRVRSKRR
jgi:tetratricopeptide (TPR) repeat protein